MLHCEGVSMRSGSFPNQKAVKSPARGTSVPAASVLQDRQKPQQERCVSKSHLSRFKFQPADALQPRHEVQSRWPFNDSHSLGARDRGTCIGRIQKGKGAPLKGHFLSRVEVTPQGPYLRLRPSGHLCPHGAPSMSPTSFVLTAGP